MIGDQIVFGTNDAETREKLMADKLTLQRTEEVCKAAELTAANQEIWTRDDKPVNAMQKTRGGSRAKQQKSCKCRKCGRAHAPFKRSAYRKTCRACHKRNHFAVCCRTKPQVVSFRATKAILKFSRLAAEAIGQTGSSRLGLEEGLLLSKWIRAFGLICCRPRCVHK